MRLSRHLTLAVILAGSIFAMAACDDEDSDGVEDIQDAGTTVSGTVSDAVDGDDGADDEMQDRFNDLQDRVGELSDDAAAEIEDAWEAVQDAFQEFEDATEDERDQLRDAFDTVADEFEQQLDELQEG